MCCTVYNLFSFGHTTAKRRCPGSNGHCGTYKRVVPTGMGQYVQHKNAPYTHHSVWSLLGGDRPHKLYAPPPPSNTKVHCLNLVCGFHHPVVLENCWHCVSSGLALASVSFDTHCYSFISRFISAVKAAARVWTVDTVGTGTEMRSYEMPILAPLPQGDA